MPLTRPRERDSRGQCYFARGWYEAALKNRMHPLVRFLLHRMITEQTSYQVVAKQAGVNASSVRRWWANNGVGSGPLLWSIEAMLGFFGYTLIAVPTEWVEGNKLHSCTGVAALRAMLERAEKLEAEEQLSAADV